ncbi:restriction endonuclease subunit S [Xanthomonas phaseoli]|uniref:restriction endonuclease subunit S n=1 Tax=Xanthomonas phaseoli TaxID=1985254 RepID=UPI0005286DC4|nr:restriction endonuclease subunit S [Xanthomonas phaseoli]
MAKPVATRLGDVVNFKRGYDLPESTRRTGPFPVISSGGFSGYHDEYKVAGEGVVTGRYGTLGEMHYYDGKYWPHNTALYVTDFKGNFPKYVYYLLSCLGRMDTGDKSTVPGVNRNDLHELKIPVIKDKKAQKTIAAVLSILDAKIELNNRINAKLEALAKTIYDYWFVQFDFPDAKGCPYKTSGGKMVWNETLKREIPTRWGAGSLDDLGQIVGGSTPSTLNPEHFGKDMIPWITPKDLSNNKGNKFIARGESDVSEAGKRSASLTLYPAGTVLMSSRAPVGYLAIALNPVTTNQGFKSFVPSKGYGTSFVYYAVQRSLPTIIQYASGSTFVEISAGVLKSVHAVLPVKAVVDAFCRQIEQIVQRQQIAELENTELTQLRDWLLPLLMNGQVKPADM